MVNLKVVPLNEAGQVLRMYEHAGDAFCALIVEHGKENADAIREDMHSILDSALTTALAFPPPGVPEEELP